MGLMKYGSILRAQIFAAINIRETYVSEIYFRDFVTNVKLSSAKVKRSAETSLKNLSPTAMTGCYFEP